MRWLDLTALIALFLSGVAMGMDAAFKIDKDLAIMHNQQGDQ